ncbi:hypothetical protein B0H16DRAFT_1541946 [Mycena metata]|uniref:Uncharacterized protein n=1 Tax=Mycena metata TaxID=1033252 RepID=A0AAD7J146_9AGAR|nr:hypothetical protein B0H16DRAFT_1541946 [Mycena metata]
MLREDQAPISTSIAANFPSRSSTGSATPIPGHTPSTHDRTLSYSPAHASRSTSSPARIYSPANAIANKLASNFSCSGLPSSCAGSGAPSRKITRRTSASVLPACSLRPGTPRTAWSVGNAPSKDCRRASVSSGSSGFAGDVFAGTGAGTRGDESAFSFFCDEGSTR